MLSARINTMSDRVNATIFFGRKYSYKQKEPWKVSLEYSFEDIRVEVEMTGTTLENTLEDAWARLDLLVRKGLGPSAMMPALEAPKVPLDDDEIPF